MSEMKIRRVAFIYLSQDSEVYYLGDDVGHSVQRRPQLGLQYLCAVLEKRGVSTDIFDQTVLHFDMDRMIKDLKGYDMAGFYCSDPQEDQVKEYSKKIKSVLGIPVLVGGPTTLANSTFLDHGCDIVVRGEGEKTIQEILDHYEGQRDIDSIKGISYKKDGVIVHSPEQELINNLDELPFPDRSKVDINAYHDYFLFGMRKPYITVTASRGCVYKCHFCTSCKIWGYKYRIRTADNVLAEIDEAVSKYKVKYIAFQDDIFGITNTWIEEFCGKLIKRPYRVRWMAILHPFSVKTDKKKILGLMRRAGCDTLSFGLQSAHPQILKNTQRYPAEPEELEKTLKVANSLGFVTAVAYIFGLPGETRETANTTIDYSLRCGSTVVNYFMLSVLKGSEMERLYKDKKICDLSKEEIDELASYASKRFYTRPMTILRIAYFILKNPEWIFKVGINLPSILSRVGFAKTKHRSAEVS